MKVSASGRVRKYFGSGRRSPARPHATQQRSRAGRTGPLVEAADQSATTTSRKLRA
jgi:hypothetical protein